MVDKIIQNNSNDFDHKLLEYSVQLKALNYLRKNDNIKDEMYKKVKNAINENYRIEVNKRIS